VLVDSALPWVLEERLGIETGFLSVLVSAGTELWGEMFGTTSPVYISFTIFTPEGRDIQAPTSLSLPRCDTALNERFQNSEIFRLS